MNVRWKFDHQKLWPYMSINVWIRSYFKIWTSYFTYVLSTSPSSICIINYFNSIFRNNWAIFIVEKLLSSLSNALWGNLRVRACMRCVSIFFTDGLMGLLFWPQYGRNEKLKWLQFLTWVSNMKTCFLVACLQKIYVRRYFFERHFPENECRGGDYYI